MNSQNNNASPNGLIKLFIVVVSLAASFSFWVLFSNKDIKAQNTSDIPAQGPAGNALNLPPLPTLAPLQNPLINAEVSSALDTQSITLQPTPLRDAIPPQPVYQPTQPIQLIVPVQPAQTGGGAGSVPQPQTATGSSRP